MLGLSILSAAIRKAVWTPATLFASGEQGVWYDPSDFSTMFQDSAGSTPVTAVGQPVGRILDKSGRGNRATQATAASRPVLQQDANGKYYLAFDGVDDGVSTGAITLGSNMDCFLLYRIDANPFDDAIISTTSGSAYALAMGGTGPINKGSGAPTYVVNGNVVASTRPAVLAAAPVGVFAVIEIRNLNLSNWGDVALSNWAPYRLAQSVVGFIICPAQTPEIRTKIRQYLGAKVGITL